jgi:putative NADH-flavin reductase
MRVVIFGASSRAGLYITKEALERGHLTAVFTRRPGDFPLGHPKLDIIGGDVMDAAAVAQASFGARGIICALGTRPGKAAAAFRSKAMENILLGMKEAGCRRVVWLSSMCCVRSGVRLFFGRGFSQILAGRAPSTREDELGPLRASGLDWTVVDAPRLREVAGPGPVRVQIDRPAGRYVCLADLGVFLVEELEGGRHTGKLISIFSA